MIKEKESILFLRQTASLLKAGIPLLRTLNMIKEQSQNKSDIDRIIISLEAGLSFSEALDKIGWFKPFIPSFRVAERDGMLEEAFLRAAEQSEKKKAFRDGIKRTLTYPVIIVALSLLCLLLLVFVILPNFARIFTDLNCPLPLVTQILMIFPSYWMAITAFFGLAIFLVIKIWTIDDCRYKIPVIGKIFLNLSIADLCHSLGSQLKAGVPIIEAMQSTASGIKSKKINELLKEIITEIQGGGALSISFKKRKSFPDLLSQMTAVGEESGSLSQMLLSAGEMFESDGEQALKRLTLYVEPAATLTVGLVVGFVALAVMMPLFSMMGSLL